MSTFDAGAGARRVPALEIPLDWEPVAPDMSERGQPRVASVEIAAVPGLEVGVWAHTPGVSIDVEADEVFVVLAGRATIEVEGGPTLDVGPGDVGVLPPGARTRWTVHEELRKVYVIRQQP